MQEFLPLSHVFGQPPSGDQTLEQQFRLALAFHEAVTCANPKPLYQVGKLRFSIEGLSVAVERSAEDGRPRSYTLYYQCRTSTGTVLYIQQRNDPQWYRLCRALSLPVELQAQSPFVPRSQQEMPLADHTIAVVFTAAQFLEVGLPDSMRDLRVETLPMLEGIKGRWRVSFGSRMCEVHWLQSGDYIAREWPDGDEEAGVPR
jgi:hypothetical protein